jgi:hypothetical protein
LENAILAVLFAAIMVWLIVAAREEGVGGITYSQAIRFSLFRFLPRHPPYGLRHEARIARAAGLLPAGAIQLDIHILRALLPAQTFHIDATSDEDTTHALTQFRSVMAGQGICCLYLPPGVEPSPRTMSLLEVAGSAAREAGARVVPIFLRGTRSRCFSLWTREQAPRSLLPQVTIAAAPGMSLAGDIKTTLVAFALLDGMARAKLGSLNSSLSLFEALARGREALWSRARDLRGRARHQAHLSQAADRRPGARGPDRGTALDRVRRSACCCPIPAASIVSLFAVLSAGRVPALLNYTAGPAALVSALSTGNISHGPDVIGLRGKGRSRRTGRTDTAGRRERGLRRGPANGDRPRRQAARAPLLAPGARDAPAGRSGHHPLHVRLRGHAEGRGALLAEPGDQRGAGGLPGRFLRHRHAVQRPAVLSLLRSSRRGVAAALPRGPALSLSVAAALQADPGTGAQGGADDHVRHRHLSQRLCAGRPGWRFRQSEDDRRRRRGGEAGNPPDVSRALRYHDPRRLRHDRGVTRGVGQFRRAGPRRHGGAAAARHGGAHRACRGHRRGWTTADRGPQPDARLSARRPAGRAAAARRILARHRRHRHDRRRGVHHHSRPCPALRQDRRRDDLARRRRDDGQATLAGCRPCRGRRAGQAARRADRARHHEFIGREG